MAIADPRLHIICGICGCNKELSWEFVPGDDSCPEDIQPPDVHIVCNNCASLTGLLDVMVARVTGIPAGEKRTVDLDKFQDICRRTFALLENREPGMPENTGRFLDGWGNKITMWVVANPHSFTIEDPYGGDGQRTLEYIRATAQGYGLVKFHKAEDSLTFESWPVYGEFKNADELQQHPGFPKTVKIR